MSDLPAREGQEVAMRMCAAVASIAALSGLRGSCRSPLSAHEVLALKDAEARWAARGFADYAFETSVSCFCDPETSGWARVEVSAGVVTRVVMLADGHEVDAAQRTYFPTVQRLFDSIRHATDNGSVRDVSVQYDPEFGYPTLIRIAPEPDVLDGGSVRYARNAAPLP
jgi:uncharacterized protein DUF6174